MKELLCGKNSVMEAIDNKLPIGVIYTTRPQEILNKSLQIKQVDKNFLDKMTTENHQGFVAEMLEYNYFDLSTIFHDKPEKVLILDHIQDPRNLGAIMRSANASGVKHIIIPKDRAAKVTPSALKVSSGGYVDVKVIRVSSLLDAVIKLKENSFWIYATSLEGAKNINDAKFNYPLALIMGNEEKGVSSTLLKQSDEKIFIKMNGTVQSLNVSVATGIILFKI